MGERWTYEFSDPAVPEAPMPELAITFHSCLQDSQELGSNDEHMVSRINFGISIEGRHYFDLYVHVKQPVGESFEEGTLEVGRPQGYDGPLDYDVFRKYVEGYYRDLIGSRGSAIRVEGDSNVRMYDNLIEKEVVCTMNVPDGPGGW